MLGRAAPLAMTSTAVDWRSSSSSSWVSVCNEFDGESHAFDVIEQLESSSLSLSLWRLDQMQQQQQHHHYMTAVDTSSLWWCVVWVSEWGSVWWSLAHVRHSFVHCACFNHPSFELRSFITLPQAGERGIVMSVYICLSVCPHAYLRNHTSKNDQTLPNFLCILSVTVERSFCGGITICYSFPVLWMTSCFHVTCRIWRCPATAAGSLRCCALANTHAACCGLRWRRQAPRLDESVVEGVSAPLRCLLHN